MNARRENGLLHHRRPAEPATATRAPTSTARTSARARRSPGSRPEPVARGDTDACAPTDDWNSIDGGTATAVSSRIAGGGGVAAGGRDGLLPLTGAARRAVQRRCGGAEPVSLPTVGGSLHRSSPPSAVDDPLVVHAADDAALRSTTTSRSRPRDASRSSRPADPSRAIRPTDTWRSIATTRSERDCDLRLLRADGRTGPIATPSLPDGGRRPERRRPGLLHDRDPLNLRDLNGGKTDVYEWKRRRARLDLHRDQRVRLSGPLRRPRRQGRLLLHPRRAGRPRITTETW